MPVTQQLPVPAANQSIEPLVQLLQQELVVAGIASPGAVPASIREFTHWYLEVVQLLEAHVAAGAEQKPMMRSEVELMCRCALSARDLREAIDVCARYCESLHPRAGRIALQHQGGDVLFRLDSLRLETTTASSLCDITGLFAFSQLFEWLVAADLQLLQVCIGPIERGDVLPFLKLFRAPVLMGGDDYSLRFPGAVLELPVVRRAAEFTGFFEVYPCGVFRRDSKDLVHQVAAILSAAARQGTGLPTQESLAHALGVSLSTFRRSLNQSGTTFRKLREDNLQEAALALLERGELSISDIALHLGFSDAAAFRRAFRQWTGCSPTGWRLTGLPRAFIHK